MQEKFKLLSSKGFTAGLLLLLLNDFILKAAFHNDFTGKLSDVAGLFIFPLFWLSFFPKHKRTVFFLTGLLFIYWKSPLSQPVIDGWNALDLFSIQRIVDYSDLLALLILPLSFYYSTMELRKPAFRVHPVFPVMIAAFSFIATSKYDRSARFAYGDTYNSFNSDPATYGKAVNVEMPPYTFNMQPAEILALMKKYSFAYINDISTDSLLYMSNFNTFSRLPPLVKVTNTRSGDKTIMRIESIVFDTSALHSTNKSLAHYKTENAAAFATEFAGWFIPEFVAVKSTDSLHAIGMTITKTYPDSAIAIYNKALKIAPSWLSAELMLNYRQGTALYNKQQYHDALQYYYRSDSLNRAYSTRRAPTYSGMEAAYRKLGQKDSAKKYRKLSTDVY